MKKKEILLMLTDRWCDWEASYAVAVANAFSDYHVKTIAIDKEDKVSMGGLATKIDFSLADYEEFTNLALVILPGGLSWEESHYDEIAELIKKVREHRIPIAAICGATYFLCRQGFLNQVKHTGDSLELFKSVTSYQGEQFYIPAQVVYDQGILTAKETAAVEFAYEIFKILKVDTEEKIEQWFDYFQNGAVR